MAFKFADRIKETTTTTGTGNVTLLGALSQFRAFSSEYSNDDTFYYAIVGQDGTEWEVGVGTYVSATPAIARTTVLESSNAGALVDFSAGTKEVWVDFPAEAAAFANIKHATMLGSGGTTKDFTVPARTKIIDVMLADVSTNGTSPIILRIGDSGGIETAAYKSSESTINGASVGGNNYTTAFQFAAGHDGNVTYQGVLTLRLMDPATHLWLCTGNISRSDAVQGVLISGFITLTSEITAVQLTTVGGVNTFDGSTKVNCSYR